MKNEQKVYNIKLEIHLQFQPHPNNINRKNLYMLVAPSFTSESCE